MAIGLVTKQVNRGYTDAYFKCIIRNFHRYLGSGKSFKTIPVLWGHLVGEAKKNNKTPSLQGKWDKNTTMVLDHLYVTVPIVFPYYALKTRKMHRHDDLVSKSDSGHSDDDDDDDDDSGWWTSLCRFCCYPMDYCIKR